MTTCTAEGTVKATQEQFDLLLDDVIDHFDFDRVHNVMKHLDWKWASKNLDDLEIPSIQRLRSYARQLLRQAYKECCTIGSGGFEAVYKPWRPEWGDEDKAGYLGLRFIVEECFTAGINVL